VSRNGKELGSSAAETVALMCRCSSERSLPSQFLDL